MSVAGGARFRASRGCGARPASWPPSRRSSRSVTRARPLAEFLACLHAHGVRQLVDVRTFPGSRRHPQYGAAALARALAADGIGYVHLPALGGRRRPRPDSPNDAWRNQSFRGYADHMATPEFAAGLAELLALAAAAPTAIMCAEAVPWRCHRSLIADALLAREVAVVDIFSETVARPHKLSPIAVVTDGEVRYPGAHAPAHEQAQLRLAGPAGETP
jgi:hypothetical protein